MFFMSVLVLSANFLLLFVGWEGVGLASYLLIGFYFKKDSAANAGKKAFIVNRIGDFGFLLGMFLLIQHFGTLSFAPIFASITAHPAWQGGFLTAIALLLVVGATGKSAQIPLYIWLPDAMEGPTPVSALIHAATMVTAGVYLVARCHTLFDRSPYALGVVAILGAATALCAACVGIVQASRPTRQPSSIWSRTPSSKHCSSSRRAPSFTPSRGSRTCASWAACAGASRSPSGP
jgi:NADH-quinone oxidoreductase subunit L